MPRIDCRPSTGPALGRGRPHGSTTPAVRPGGGGSLTEESSMDTSGSASASRAGRLDRRAFLRLVIGAAGLAATGSLLAACGGGAAPAASTTAPAAAPTSAPAAAPTTAPA